MGDFFKDVQDFSSGYYRGDDVIMKAREVFAAFGVLENNGYKHDEDNFRTIARAATNMQVVKDPTTRKELLTNWPNGYEGYKKGLSPEQVKLLEGRGSQQNALRHATFSATLSARYGPQVAMQLLSAIEIDFNQHKRKYEKATGVDVDIFRENLFVWPKGMSLKEFVLMVDSIVDIRNNACGLNMQRGAYDLNFKIRNNSSSKNSASIATSFYHKKGLNELRFYVIDGKLYAQVLKVKLSVDQYNAIQYRLSNVSVPSFVLPPVKRRNKTLQFAPRPRHPLAY